MRLWEFYDYKNQLMEDILTDDNILRLLSEDGREPVPPEQLMYSQVFPYEYVPETLEHAKTYICCEVDIQKATSKTFLSPVINVWVFTHRSKMRLPEGGVRVDEIVSRIADKLNGSRMYGLGELDLYSCRRFAPINDYQGKSMTFHAVDFNRPHPTNMPVPGRRNPNICQH